MKRIFTLQTILCVITGIITVACSAQQTPATVEPSSSPPPPSETDASAGPVSRPGDDEMRPPATHREMPFVEARNEASPLVTFRVAFESGSSDDPVGREGLTRLAANLMVEGGTENLSYEELTRRLFPMAAELSFHVDRDMTVFFAQVHKDHLAAFYPIFRDVLLHPRLADEDFRRVRAQKVSALTLELRGSDDERLGQEYLQSLIYANHPYGHPALGTERGLAAMTVEDVRAHRARVFCRDRVIVGIAGGYPADLAARIRDDMRQLPETCAIRDPLPIPARPHGIHVVVIDKPNASSTAVSIGFPVAYTREEGAANSVEFVLDYLGLHRQSSGVLYQTIREARGLNYGDYAYGHYFEQEPGSRFPQPNVDRRQQFASIWLRPLRPPTAHFALRAALRAYARTLEQGISPADFDRTRTFLTGYINLFVQTDSSRLGYLIDDTLNHHTDGMYIDRLRTSWQSLDRDAALTNARRELTTTDLWIAIVAPNARELADAIGRNAPSPITYDSPKSPEILAEDHEIETYPLSVRPEDVRVVPIAETFR